jgi:K+-sensing histidine kinase KdpD
MRSRSSFPTSVTAPWFEQRPRAALAVAAVLYVGILILRLLVGTPVDAYSMLYVLPVALVAIVFGVRAGVLAGVAGVLLTAVWVIARDVTLSPTGWLSRVLPLLLLGFLVGQATDRLRRAEDEQRRLARAALLHRKAIEINDSLIQGMAAAKWSLEAGRVEAGLQALDETMVRAQDLVSSLIRDAEMDGQTESLERV